MPKTKTKRERYSVLLLYPDYYANSYGQDTYYSHVEAASPGEAFRLACERCNRDTGGDIDNPEDDLYCLLIVRGHRVDLAARAMEEIGNHA